MTKPLTLPVRALGKIGVIRDVDPISLPVEALTRADNVVCSDDSISRLPVLRKMGTATIDPAHCLAHSTMASFASSEFIIVGKDFAIIRWQQQGDQGGPGFAINLSAPGIERYEYPGGVTSTRTNNIIYVARPDQPLVAMQVSGERFAKVEGWDIRRTNAIRSLGSMLVCIGVTHKDGRTYPTAVLNSDTTLYDGIPSEATFIPATDNLANETTLAEISTRLIDGWPLIDSMFLYGREETWIMRPSSGPFPFEYARSFDLGVINTNCVVTKNNVSYVFGDSTIWSHDLNSQRMILDGMNRNYLYKYLARGKEHLCFTVTKPGDDLIYFCYPSLEPTCAFPLQGRDACNRAIVYNVRAKNWTFADLAYHVHACVGSTDAGVRYIDEEANGHLYSDEAAMGTTYEDLSAQSRNLILWISPGPNAPTRPPRPHNPHPIDHSGGDPDPDPNPNPDPVDPDTCFPLVANTSLQFPFPFPPEPAEGEDPIDASFFIPFETFVLPQTCPGSVVTAAELPSFGARGVEVVEGGIFVDDPWANGTTIQYTLTADNGNYVYGLIGIEWTFEG